MLILKSMNSIWSGMFFSVFGSLCISAAKINLEAHPKEVDFYNTKSFNVNCTYDPDPQKVSGVYLISLVLSRVSPTGSRTPKELASMDVKAPLHVLDPDPSPDVKFTGRASEKDLSYLSGDWSKFDFDLVGTYVCEANVMDTVGHLMKISNQVDVVEEANSLQAFLEELQKARAVLKEQQACCLNMSAQVAEIQAWRKTVSLSLAYLEKMMLMSQPSGVYNNRTMYYASKYKIKDVDTAEAVCQTMGGYLAEIDDDDEWQFIKPYLDISSMKRFYIAGRDDVIQNQWYWPRSHEAVNFTSWAPAMPDLVYKHDCIAIAKPLSTWAYYNEYCSLPLPRDGFLCEVTVN